MFGIRARQQGEYSAEIVLPRTATPEDVQALIAVIGREPIALDTVIDPDGTSLSIGAATRAELDRLCRTIGTLWPGSEIRHATAGPDAGGPWQASEWSAVRPVGDPVVWSLGWAATGLGGRIGLLVAAAPLQPGQRVVIRQTVQLARAADRRAITTRRSPRTAWSSSAPASSPSDWPLALLGVPALVLLLAVPAAWRAGAVSWVRDPERTLQDVLLPVVAITVVLGLLALAGWWVGLKVVEALGLRRLWPHTREPLPPDIEQYKSRGAVWRVTIAIIATGPQDTDPAELRRIVAAVGELIGLHWTAVDGDPRLRRGRGGWPRIGARPREGSYCVLTAEEIAQWWQPAEYRT